MKTIIGEYHEGRLSSHFSPEGDDIPENILQELKGRFTKEFREANIQLTQEQLLAAATPDQDVIQAVHSLDALDVVLNSLGKYTTEWYELHHPDQETTWTELAQHTLEERGLTSLHTALKAALTGRDEILVHVETVMQHEYPNLAAVAGSFVGAKLIAAAGSIDRLARLPATTVQLLGAEQALFRHLKNRRSPPPKHGILFNHALVQKVHPKQKGKMARQVANAIFIAVKVDFFKGEYIGDRLKAKTEAQYHALART